MGLSRLTRRIGDVLSDPVSFGTLGQAGDALEQSGPDLSSVNAQRATNQDLENLIRTQNRTNQQNILDAESENGGPRRIYTDDGIIEVTDDGTTLTDSENIQAGNRIRRAFNDADPINGASTAVNESLGFISRAIRNPQSFSQKTVEDINVGELDTVGPQAVSPAAQSGFNSDARRRTRQQANSRFGRGATVLTSPLGLSSGQFQRRRLLG